MKKVKPLNYKLLKNKPSPTQFNFQTTKKLKPLAEFLGQERALEALNFGIGIKRKGYNLYAMGPSGIGKYSLVRLVLDKRAKNLPTPPDWCYLHNFETPEKPIAIKLPAGKGFELQQDMKSMVDELGVTTVAVLESREYHIRIKKINNEYRVKRKRNPENLNIREQHEKIRKLQEKMISEVITPFIKKLRKKYSKYKEVISYLIAVQNDIVTHINEFVKEDEKTNLLTFSLENPALTKYKVNLLVDNRNLDGAPVIFEENPSYSTLISRVEHTAHLGTLVTNFSLIRSGSLQQANGGYLIIEAYKLKKNDDAWQALKTALHSKMIKIKPVEQDSDSIRPVSLEPMPIPLDIKVILIGDRSTYYSLCQKDNDFTELFKVPVDFDEMIDRNEKNIQLYARLIATIIKRENLHHFEASAVTEIISYSSRLSEDIEKLSTHIRDIEDLVLEADYWATQNKRKIVKAMDVKQAINAQIRRMDRSREIYYEDILRDFIIIKTSGYEIGQINCLSVRAVGNFSYGHPTRVTARIRLGKGKVMDIQREIKLAGPLHSKASLTISNFLASRFNLDYPFTLAASLSFEQIYCWTEGDSASVGELCAILSAVTNVPLNQSLAITGSLDQYGFVQAVGGINDKIEGFFNICKARGLTGKQGVIIPAVNVQNLILHDDVIEAAKNKKFFIYPINTADEAIELLTGETAGERNRDGHYPAGSLYDKVEKRLQVFLTNRNAKGKKI